MNSLIQQALDLALGVPLAIPDYLQDGGEAANAKELIGYVDYTTLKPTDNQESVSTLAKRAVDLNQSGIHVGALCVHPNLVAHTKQALSGASIPVAAVATSFPEGQTFIEVKVLETEMTVAAGADEVDMVINRGAMLAGDYNTVFDEIKAVKAACGQAHLKVILENCDLVDDLLIAKASAISMYAGADFIKTSTGKGAYGARPEHAVIMCRAIKALEQAEGRKVGFKAAGGIATVDDARLFRAIVKNELGIEYCRPKLFRIGASRLLDTLIKGLSS